MRSLGKLAFAGVSLLAISMPAFAQSADAPAAGASEDEIITITGTLIRGVAPGGSQSIAVTQEDMEAIGAGSTQQLLTNLPSSGVFLNIPSIEGRNNTRLTVNRPSLRNLGNTSSATAPTLLLLDGHRMSGTGIRQNSPDIDAIPSGAIERIEVVTDGGSSIYGSDAVGGVINLITRKEFSGVEAKARYGFGENYQEVSADLTAGVKWDGGSAYVSYNYAWHDSLYGRDRDHVRRFDYINNVGASFGCGAGNVSVQGVGNFPLSGAAVPLGPIALAASTTANRCDATDDATFLPAERRHSVFASFMIDNGSATFGVKGYYMNRVNTSDGGPFRGSATLCGPAVVIPSCASGVANAFYRPINGSTAPQTVQFQFPASFGTGNIQRTRLSTWGITPYLEWDIGGDWRLNAVVTYGEGHGLFDGRITNPATIPTAVFFQTFDPFNLTSPATLATLNTAFDYFDYGRATNKLTNGRLVVDGPLFALPGGDLKVAVGAEFSSEFFGAAIQNTNAAGIPNIPFRTASRNVTSVFGELNAPLIGADNAGTFHSLSLSLSGRYDRYSDFGSTFNPKLGIDFAPVEWLKLRGNWGKSFQAPGLADSPLIQPPTLSNLQSVIFANPALPAPTTVNPAFTQVFLGGVVPGLRPQKATTWSLGFDMKPPVIDGLSLGMTYYNIKFIDQIAIIPIFIPSLYYPGFVGTYALYTDQVALAAKVAELAALASNPATITSVPIGNLYSVGDGRTRNLQNTRTSGLDFYLRYKHDTSFGNVYFNWSGNYILNFENQVSALLGYVDVTKTATRLRMSTTLGANIGNFNGQVTWIHSGGFDTTPSAASLGQSRVGAYNIFNLFMNYDVKGDGAFADLSFSLGVDNLFNTAPPPYNGSIGNLDGYGNAFNIGRVVKLGVTKKF